MVVPINPINCKFNIVLKLRVIEINLITIIIFIHGNKFRLHKNKFTVYNM